jgi:uncharacterized membrane protein YqjE
MNFFWDNVFDYFKDRRYGAIFFGSLALLFAVFGLGTVLFQVLDAYALRDYLIYALPAAGGLFLIWIFCGIRRLRRRRWDRYKSSPLSRDELSKARSKLRTNRTFKRS